MAKKAYELKADRSALSLALPSGHQLNLEKGGRYETSHDADIRELDANDAVKAVTDEKKGDK